MNIDQLLNQIEDIVESGSKSFRGGKISVDGEAIKTALEDIRLSLPTEISQAKIIVADRNNILSKAKNESVSVVTAAQEKSRALVSAAEDRVRDLVLKTEDYCKTKVDTADAQAKQIVESANNDAGIIKANAQIEATAIIDNSEVMIRAKEESEALLASAKEEAEKTIADAKAKAEEILTKATEEADAKAIEAIAISDEAIDKANKWSAEIRIAAGDFIEDIMKQADDALTSGLNEVRNARNSIKMVTGRIEAVEISGPSEPIAKEDYE